jgi:hypothetical protein
MIIRPYCFPLSFAFLLLSVSSCQLTRAEDTHGSETLGDFTAV